MDSGVVALLFSFSSQGVRTRDDFSVQDPGELVE